MRSMYAQIVGIAIACLAAVPSVQAETAPAGSGANLCALVSKEDVSRALRVAIVPAEASETNLPGCDF